MFKNLLLLFTFLFSSHFTNGQSQCKNYSGIVNFLGFETEVHFENICPDERTFKLRIPNYSINQESYIRPSRRHDTTELHDFKVHMPFRSGEAYLTYNEDSTTLSGTLIYPDWQSEFTLNLNPSSVDYSKQINQIDSLIDSLLINLKVPGAAIAIIHKNNVLLNKGYGFRNSENNKTIDSETLFPIASLTKGITALGLKLLEKKNPIKFNTRASVQQYLPNFNNAYTTDFASLSIEHLLSHQANIPELSYLWNDLELDIDEIINRLKYVDSRAWTRRFGTFPRFSYSNIMYAVAAKAAENVFNKSFEDQLIELILKPLNMTQTTFNKNKVNQHINISQGYKLSGNKASQIALNNISAIRPAAGLYSTSSDLLKWAQYLLNKKGLTEDKNGDLNILNSIFNPRTTFRNNYRQKPGKFNTSYGLGWFISDYEGTKLVYHGGNLKGFSSTIYLAPDHDLGIVVLSNLDRTHFPDIVALSAIDLILGKQTKEWQLIHSQSLHQNYNSINNKMLNRPPSHFLCEYAGQYEHIVYGKTEILTTDEKLILKTSNTIDTLIQQHYNTFQIGDGPRSLTFNIDQYGKIGSYNMPIELNDSKYRKTFPTFSIFGFNGGEFEYKNQLIKIVHFYNPNIPHEETLGKFKVTLPDGKEIITQINTNLSLIEIEDSNNEIEFILGDNCSKIEGIRFDWNGAEMIALKVKD